MGYTPPNPGKLSALVTAAITFAHDARSSGFRTPEGMKFPVLTATSKAGQVEWEIDAITGACPLLLLSEGAYAILREGELSADGLTITHHGQSYFARAVRHLDGSQWVELVSA